MFRPSLRNPQEKCAWLAVAASLLIVTGTVTATLLWPPESRASHSAADAGLSLLTNVYQSPSHCRTCHAEQFQAWSGTSHAGASFDPLFQVYLDKAQTPGDCFSCHTTGYNSATGQFVLAGVTCEACHGPYREQHPAASMMIASPEEVCGTCHTNTLAEWASSRHAKVQVTCTDCHEVHSQKLHAAENTNILCAECHRDQTLDPVHIAHAQSSSTIHCIDCHVARPEGRSIDLVKGQAGTGHAFGVLVSTCSDCHPTPLHPETTAPQ